MKEREVKVVALLETDKITMRFGGLVAVNDFSLRLEKGQIVGLIGPNGAGKTTAFNMITGVYYPSSGRITFQDREITAKKADYITKMGIARTFQNIRLFSSMSVMDNVMVAKHTRLNSSPLAAVFGLPGYSKEMKEFRRESEELLDKVGLSSEGLDKATSLPYGKQRRLEIARALATKPQVLLLDEPAAGMNPSEAQELMNFIRQVRDDFKVSILMIEHHMKVVMGICENIYVLDHGVTIAQGPPAVIQNDEKVIQAYLGVDDHA